MIDTVRLSVQDLDLDPSRLRGRGWTHYAQEVVDAEGVVDSREHWQANIKGGSPHFLSYSPKLGELKLETSLPKVLHGENASLLKPSEIPLILDRLSNRVADAAGADIPHVGDWQIRGRLDSVFSWQVGKRLPDYLHALKAVQLPRHRSESVDREATVYWRNKARVIRLYDKGKETGLPEAKGLLRLEVQSNRGKSELSNLAGVASLKAKDVCNWENARAVLSHYLDRLGGDLVISSEEKLFDLLCDKCGAQKAIRLMGLVAASRLYGRDELIAKGCNRKTLWRNSREIAQAGASVGTVKSGLLPPLVLPDVRDYTGASGRV